MLIIAITNIETGISFFFLENKKATIKWNMDADTRQCCGACSRYGFFLPFLVHVLKIIHELNDLLVAKY